MAIDVRRTWAARLLKQRVLPARRPSHARAYADALIMVLRPPLPQDDLCCEKALRAPKRRSIGQNPHAALAMLAAELLDCLLDGPSRRLSVVDHQASGGGRLDAVGLDGNVVIVAADECHGKTPCPALVYRARRH